MSTTSIPQANSSEPQLPAPVAKAELSAGPAETAKISDPVADLKKLTNFTEAVEFMVAAEGSGILRVNEQSDFEPADPKNDTAVNLVRTFNLIKKRAHNEERAKSKTSHAAKFRKGIKNVVNVAKPEKARTHQTPELILISPEEYHKLDLFKEENKPLPQSRLYEAAHSIAHKDAQGATLLLLDHLVLKQSEALAKKIELQVKQIELLVQTYARLNEITENLVKQGWLIRRGRDLVANPNFGSTINLENAVRSKEKEIEAFMKEYNETANDSAGLEITIEKIRRVGRETKTFSDRYAVRFDFGAENKTIRLSKVLKRFSQSEGLDTNRSYNQHNLPNWLSPYVNVGKNGVIALKKEAPKAQKQEPLTEIIRQPVAQGSASTENTKNASTPEANKDPMAELVDHLNQLISAHHELKIITTSFKAYRGQIKPETLHPGLTAEKLEKILRGAFKLKEDQPTPRSLRDLAKLSMEWNPEDLLSKLKGSAGSLKVSIEEPQKEAVASAAAQEKAA